MSTTEPAVDCVLANHAAQAIEDVVLNTDEDVALDLDEPKRCLQTEQTRQVDDKAFLSKVCGFQPPGWLAGSKSRY